MRVMIYWPELHDWRAQHLPALQSGRPVWSGKQHDGAADAANAAVAAAVAADDAPS